MPCRAERPSWPDLLDNGWPSLTVVDPEQDHRAFRHDGEPLRTEGSPEAQPVGAATVTAGAADGD